MTVSTLSANSPTGHLRTPVELSPTQAAAFTRLTETVSSVPVTVLTGDAGVGKTTLLECLIAGRSGIRISCRDMLEMPVIEGHPSIEEPLHRLVTHALGKADIVCVEDIDL